MRTVILAAILPMVAGGQALTQPPWLIRVVRTPSAPGAALARYAESGAGVHVIGMSSITGAAETWQVEAHDSFASIEELELALRPPGSVRNAAQGSTNLIAVYRPWWSYRGNESVQAMRTAHYFQISTYQISLGSEPEFAELLRARKASFDSVNLDRPDMVFQVIAGAPSGTYLVLSPLPSLKTLDDGVARPSTYARVAASAASKAGSKINAEGELSHENILFRVEPRLSYISEDFAAADPTFWGVRPK